LIDVVIAIALVTLQHGFALVGDATVSPIAKVGVAAEEQGTHTTQ
jgi:hypothetical protein